MSYSISNDSNANIVFVIYDGTVSLPDRKEAVAEVCDRFSEHGPLRIIVNVVKLEMDLSSEEQKEFGAYLASHKGLAGARVAVLHEETHNPNLMIDAIAFSNGYLLAEFTSQRDAVAWLVE